MFERIHFLAGECQPRLFQYFVTVFVVDHSVPELTVFFIMLGRVPRNGNAAGTVESVYHNAVFYRNGVDVVREIIDELFVSYVTT